MTAMSQISNLLCHEMTMHLSHDFFNHHPSRRLNSKARILHFLAAIYKLSYFNSSDPDIHDIHSRGSRNRIVQTEQHT
jgi:hypothetical protein